MTPNRAKLFTHGGSQAVRLPKAFRFQGGEVSIRREGERVILEPVPHDAASFWARIDTCEDAPAEPAAQPGLDASR
jgi:antitoxin VapB